MEATQKADDAREEYRAEVDDAALRLSQLPPDLFAVLAAYYLKADATWSDVARELNYSKSRIYQLRKEALNAG